MKAFENITNQGNEPAVKKATKLPEDAVNLGWFSSKEITPANTLSVVDYSHLIFENFVPKTTAEVDTMMYADEFGTLRYVRSNPLLGQVAGSPIVNSAEVSLSNKLVKKPSGTFNYNFSGRYDQFEELSFVHSYYVSTYFTIIEKTAAEYSGLETSSEIISPEKYNISVVDSSRKKFYKCRRH